MNFLDLYKENKILRSAFFIVVVVVITIVVVVVVFDADNSRNKF